MIIKYTLDLKNKKFTRKIGRFVEFEVIFKTKKAMLDFMKFYVQEPL